MPDVDALRAEDPRRLGPYELDGVLGEGGQGTVFLGTAPDGRPVAVKVLHSRLTGDDRARRLFLREASVARGIAPYCTARVVDADIDGDRPYIVSEYVEGESLHALVHRTGPRDPGGLERLAISTAAALKGIHEAGIVHRDFKPSNVLLGPDGPRVVDFGIARIIEGTSTLSSGILGTPAYMSPEQISGAAVGPPSDIFSWAITMVFAATGRPAFGQDSIPAVLHRVLNQQPDLSAIPPRLRALVAACLAKDPAHRPTAADLLTAILNPASAGRPVPSTPPSTDPTGPATRGTGLPGAMPSNVPTLPSPGAWQPAPARIPAERPKPFVAASVVQFLVFWASFIGLAIGYAGHSSWRLPTTLIAAAVLAAGVALTAVLRRDRNEVAR